MSTTVSTGTQTQFSVSFRDIYNNPLFGVGVPQWSSSNPTAGSINGVGLFTAAATVNAPSATTITATFQGITGTSTVTVTPAQDGSLADLRFVIGDANIVAIWDALTNVTLDGSGNVSQIDDARGVGVGPALVGIGATKPAIDAVNGVVTIDGAQNRLQMNADARLDLSTTDAKAVALCGTLATPFPIIIADAGVSRYVAVNGTSDFNIATSGGDQTHIPVAPSTSTVRLAVMHVSQSYAGQPTTNVPWLAVEIPGAMRAADQLGGAFASGNNILSFGGTPNNANWTPQKFRFAVLLKTSLTQAGMAALMRRAVVRGASVFAPANTKQFIGGPGDSLTRGQGASNAATTSWVPLVAASLTGYDWQKFGVNGRRASEIDTIVATLIGELAAQTNYTKRWAWPWPGTNDWALDGASAATIIAHLTSICSQLKAVGCLVGMITMMDRTDRGTTQVRLDVNTAIRGFPAAGICDVIYDAASEPHFSDPTNATYFADGVHLTDAGYAIVAAGVETAMSGRT